VISSFIAPFISVMSHNEHEFWVKLASHAAGKRDIFLCSLYMPNRNKDANTRSEAYHKLSLSLSKYAVSGDVILMGDFNAHIGTPTSAEESVAIGSGDINNVRCENGTLMVDLLTQHQLSTRCVSSGSSATRVSNGIRSMLDFIVSTTSLDMSSLIIDHDEGMFDHRPIRSIIRSIASLEKSKVSTVKMWNMKKFEGSQLEVYRSLIAKSFTGWDACRLPHISPHGKCSGCACVAGHGGAQCCCTKEQTVVDTAASSWLDAVNNAARIAIGEKTIKKGVSKPWFTKEVSEMVAEKRRLAAVMIKSESVKEARAERVAQKNSMFVVNVEHVN
jgi:hypothetical protein